MRAASLLVLALVGSGCAVSGAPVSPYGRDVSIAVRDERVRGELLGVGSDTLWVLQGTAVRAVSLSTGRRIEVRRHTFDMRRTLKWLGIAGVATGATLMAACQSYEADGGGGGNDCLAVLPATALFFGVSGLILGALNDHTTVHRLAPSDTVRLRAFSRYPQGIPPWIRDSLTIPATTAPKEPQ